MPKGTPEQFLDALNTKLDELETYTSVDSAESVEVVDQEKDPIYGEYDSTYIDQLMDKVVIEAPYPIINWTVSEDTLYIDADEGMDDGEDVVTYEVPLRDLGMDLNTIYEDVTYIIDSLYMSDITDTIS